MKLSVTGQRWRRRSMAQRRSTGSPTNSKEKDSETESGKEKDSFIVFSAAKDVGELSGLQLGVEIGDGPGQALFDRDLRFPAQDFLGLGDVGLALQRIILGQRL